MNVENFFLQFVSKKYVIVHELPAVDIAEWIKKNPKIYHLEAIV